MGVPVGRVRGMLKRAIRAWPMVSDPIPVEVLFEVRRGCPSASMALQYKREIPRMAGQSVSPASVEDVLNVGRRCRCPDLPPFRVLCPHPALRIRSASPTCGT